MSRKRKRDPELHLFLLQRRVHQKSRGFFEVKPLPEREEIDRKIRKCRRRNEPWKIRGYALLHPLRPLKVRVWHICEILEKEGFTYIPQTRYLMLPPEGTSRREAKKRRDQVIKETQKRDRKRSYPSEDGVKQKTTSLREVLFKTLGQW